MKPRPFIPFDWAKAHVPLHLFRGFQWARALKYVYRDFRRNRRCLAKMRARLRTAQRGIELRYLGRAVR